MGAYTYTEYLGDYAFKWKEFNRAEIAAAGSELKSNPGKRNTANNLFHEIII